MRTRLYSILHRWSWLIAALVVAIVMAAIFIYRSNQTSPDAKVLSTATQQFSNHAPNAQPKTSNSYPSSVLNLANWYLTLPVGCNNALPCNNGGNDVAAEIFQPDLQTFTDKYFFVTTDQNAVAFRAYANGVTTSGSAYPRSELREMTNNGSTHASWASTSGVHAMIVTEAVTHLPTAKAQVVSAQIHNDATDIIEVITDGPGIDGLGANQYKVCVRFGPNNGKETGPCLDNHYALGTYFTLAIVAADSKIKIWYVSGTTPPNTNQSPTWEEPYQGSGNYFKAGAYTQSNLDQGDTADAYGEVDIRNLLVTHSNS